MKNNDILQIQFLNKIECDQVIEYSNDMEKYLLENETDNFSRITTKYFYKYNFFRDNPQYIDRFLKIIKKELPELKFPIAVQSWVNIYRKNEGIEAHNHSGYPLYSYSANIFLGGPTNPGITYFEPKNSITIPNVMGELQIFNCGHWHEVVPNQTDEKRYSVGITFHSYEAITQHVLKNCCYNTIDSSVILLRDN